MPGGERQEQDEHAQEAVGEAWVGRHASPHLMVPVPSRACVAT